MRAAYPERSEMPMLGLEAIVLQLIQAIFGLIANNLLTGVLQSLLGGGAA